MLQPCTNLQESDIGKARFWCQDCISVKHSLTHIPLFSIQGKLPGAFYRIQDLEAQRFIGKCLVTASKRLPAKELLLDPFLASDEAKRLPKPKLGSQKPFLNDIRIEKLRLSDDRVRTNMTITGTLNPDDDTIFLKVQTADKDGMSVNSLYAI